MNTQIEPGPADEATPQSPPAVHTRVPELAVALFLFLLAMLVIVDSSRIGRGWAGDGPQAGYFPFFIGVGLAVVSAVIAVQQLMRWSRDRAVFLRRDEAASVWAMLWPVTVFIAAVAALGLYIPSIVLIAYFMRRHGGFGWAASLLVPAGFMLAVYLVFERWFVVPLPKGPLLALLGF